MRDHASRTLGWLPVSPAALRAASEAAPRIHEHVRCGSASLADSISCPHFLTSRVYDVCRETPLEPAPRAVAPARREVLLKREDLQPVFSFKLRGAYNKIAHLSADERAAGVIASSAGNHAQGVAFSARKLGIRRSS
jgi:threonine dehydratase